MELYQLRALVAVAETGQLTRAAERLHLSQPAVSAQIKALEEELGQRLFDRGSGGMTLTRAGRDLLPYAERALAAAEAMRSAARAMQTGVAARLRIGAVNDPHALRVGEFLGRVTTRHPLLELEISHDLTGRVVDRVRAGDLDASFHFGDLDDPRLAAIELGELVYCIAGPAAWADRLAGAGWDDIVAMPWVLPVAPSTARDLALGTLRAHGGAPAKVTEADSEPVIVDLVVAGVGAGFVRAEAAEARRRAGEMAIWGNARWRLPLRFIYLASRERDPAIAALVNVLSEMWARAPARVA